LILLLGLPRDSVRHAARPLGNYMAYGRNNPEGMSITGSTPHLLKSAPAIAVS
jgi:hypothetical protein